jgi:hypothetical protein
MCCVDRILYILPAIEVSVSCSVFSAGVETSESRGGREEGRCGVLHIQYEGRASEVTDILCTERDYLELGEDNLDTDPVLCCRLEWETAVIRGSHCFQALEEERLQQLKDLAACYLNHLQEMGPKMVQVRPLFTSDLLVFCHRTGVIEIK